MDRKWIKLAIVPALAAALSMSGCRRPAVRETTAIPPPTVAKGDSIENMKGEAAPATPVTPPVPGVGMGRISGTIHVSDINSHAGNMFVYIIDESKLPDKVETVASLYVPMQNVVNPELPFTLDNVPAGKWSIMAVWDAAPPYCEAMASYCPASARDVLGSEEGVSVTAGSVTDDVHIRVF